MTAREFTEPLHSHANLIEVLRWRAEHQPDQTAYVFLPTGETEEVPMTYLELDRQARAIGAHLQSLAPRGSRVMLLFQPGLDYTAAFMACLYAGMIAVPAYPPRPNRGFSRIQAISADAQANIALTTASIFEKSQRTLTETPDLQQLAWVETDTLDAGWEQNWVHPVPADHELAFLQYTSGSTGTPRGVMVSHRNISANLEAMRRHMECNADRPGALWLPPYHDMGLLAMLQALYTGFPCLLMPPTAFLQKPVRWLKTISKHRVYISGGPNFGFDLCTRKVTEAEKDTLDLSCWHVAFNGAEPIRPETLQTFSNAFARCGLRPETLYPCYGLAEGTLIVAGGLKDQPVVTKTILSEAFKQNQIVSTEPAEHGTQTLVGCGQQLFEQRLLVVNQTTLTPCQDLEIGEIWVGGKTVAHGYWNRPEDTAATFQAFLADTGEGPFLRTGDLGFFDQGELFVTGRIKDLIIVHGQNHYPQDIELTVEQCHPALRAGSGAAFTVDVAGSEQLVVVQELEFRQKPDLADVFATIQQAIAQGHDLQCHAIAIIKPGSIFKTTSGKIRRNATQAAFLANELEIVPDGLWQASSEQVAAEVLLDETPLPIFQSAGNPSQPGRDIAHWLINRIATLAKIPASEVDVRQSFARYGLSSVDAVALAGELEDWLGIPVSPTLVWDHSTIESVAHFLGNEPLPTLKPADEKELPESDLIAVVGIGCRFGGGIDSPDAFWEALRTGVDTVTEVPQNRIECRTFIEPDQSAATDSRWRYGSFLDRIDEFDARFFGITPREANRLDPQHRILLEVTWEALEQAGIAVDRLAGSQTGVFIGISTTDYSRLSLADQTELDPYIGTGNALSIAANRISYLFDLKGPSMAIDTACSSSLVAIHQACQSLRLRESSLAIVGGVNLMILPELSLTFAKANMLAADGRCKTFDARADGYVRSEGVGVVILKPLAAARREQLPVLAVIRGSATNQDGRTNGLTAPNGSSQQAVIRQALENAKVSPSEVSYIEAHGTGTPLGDPVEVLALRNVLEPHRPEDFPCVLGSVKTNLGHLEAAAGIAGVIKTVLALKYQYLPAHLHFESLNPNISLGTALVIRPTGCTWEVPPGKTRIAGVSSFGFGGTNAHIILAEAPAIPHPASGSELVDPVEHGLLLSAPTQSAVKTLASRFVNFVRTNPALDLGNLCFTSFVGRSRFRHQVVIPARSTPELLENLTRFLEEQPVPGTSLDLETLYREPNERFHRIALPTYPFERERYWVESQGSGFRVQGSGPELGFRVQGSGFGISNGEENNQANNQTSNAENQSLENLSSLSNVEPQTRNPEPRTLGFEPRTLGFEPGTRNPEPGTLGFTDFLRNQLAEVLETQPEHIPVDRSLVELGIDSLIALELIRTLQEQFGLKLTPGDIFVRPTIEKLAAFLTSEFEKLPASSFQPSAPSPQPSAPIPQFGVLSYNQRSLWFMQLLEPKSTAYHIVNAVRIGSPVNVSAFEQAFQYLVDRHEALRTTFPMVKGKPSQQVHPTMNVSFHAVAAGQWSDEQLQQALLDEAHRPFDLSRESLLRVTLFSRQTDDHILLLTLHHIIADVWSLAVLLDEFAQMYQAATQGKTIQLPAPASTPIQHALAQMAMLDSPEGDRLWNFWKTTLARPLPVLNLPTDHPRTSVQRMIGATQVFQIEQETTRQLKALSLANHTTLYVTLLSAYCVFLHQLTRQEDVIVGSPMAGRNQPELTGLIGYLVNPVPLRVNCAGDPTFLEFLERVRQTVVQGLDHQDFPLALLVERLQLERDLSRSPIFQTMFTLQKVHLPHLADLLSVGLGGKAGICLGGLEMTAWPVPRRIAQFDLDLMMAEVDDALVAILEYNTDLFEGASIPHLFDQFHTLLQSLASHPDELHITTMTPVPKPFSTPLHSHANLVEVLQFRARHQPDRLAYTFLVDGESEEATLTYLEMDRQARAIAAKLQSVAPRDARVMLLFNPGLEYVTAFFGCLYAGMTAVPAYPPRPNRGLSRIQSIVADAEASVALTSAALLAKTQTMMVHTPDLQKLAWVATDSIEAGWENEWKPVSLSPEDLAFLQYTSGSTGIPRGVMVSHANIMQNEEAMRRCMECAPERPGVSWLPPYHDMGLIGMLQAVYTGFHGVLMAPTAFLQKPLRWLKAISKYRGFVSGAPDFAYDLCARKITEEEKAGLDLSCWEVAYNGAETIRSETVNRFTDSFRSCGFHTEAMHPCYGLAEATLIVSGGRKPTGPTVKTILSEPFKYNRIEAAEHETDQTRSLVGCGVNLFEQQIVIANPDTLTRCQDLQVGEVWVAGKTVARGYWNRPEETRSTFQAFLADTGEGPFLRTGDLGFLDDGELYVTGRIKDLIIIHGQNYYPQDIELTVERSHRSLRSISGAAVSVEIGGVERLVIVQELEFRQKPDLNEVITAIRQAVAKEHELQCHAVAIIKPGSIAKTSSGKIRRHACKKAFLANELELVDGGLWQAAFEPVSIPAPAAELPVTPVLKAHPGTVHTIARWLVEQVAQLAKIPATEVDVRQPFAFYGLSSIDAVNLAGDLEKVLGIPISPTLVWDYPTIDAVSNHLATLENLTFHPPQKSETTEAIAIVGIGCRFGGHASSPEAFWELLKNGVDAVTEIPPSRWDVNAFYDPDPAAPGKSNCRSGSFVDHFDEFDPLFFNISPREATCIDPQHRVLIETTWEALESAGLPPNRLAGSETGVFVGISSNDYSLVQSRYANREQTVEAYTGLGNAHSIAANRLSYLFNLRGPSMAVDTACSSSLVAVHLACQSILNGECNLAIAGGVNLMLSPEPTISFSKARMLSPDGRCKTFDAAANGYVRGEGCGVIVLKRLSDAQRTGDHILAIIRGSAINQDGLTNGLTAPNGPSQQAVIRKAIKAARVSPTDISYVEAHGTGTPLGDPIEVQALAAVISENRPESQPCVIGSVKTNLGHLEAAAGIAGLIKTVLALHHRQIPPHLHFQQPNPNLSLEPNKLTIPRTLTTWNPINHKRLAGVSSFGFGGTNAHIILEEAPVLLPQSGRDQTTHVLTLSAQSESALRRLAGEYSEFLTRQPGHLVGNVCFSANTGRALFSHRLAILGETTDHFRTGLAAFAAGTTTQTVQTQTVKGTTRQKVAFLFGATQTEGTRISRQALAQSSIYTQAFTHCVQLGQQAALTSDDADLLTFADSIALAEVWKAFGVLPGAVLGQETGELAAAVVAGCCSIETAIAVLAARRRALDQLPAGGMTIQVATSGAHVTTFLQSGTSGVTISGVCSPEHTLVAGEQDAIATFMTRLAAAGISSQIVHPRLALHSPLVEPILASFEQSIQNLSFEEPQIPMISGVTGRQLDGVPDAMYWRQQLRQMLKLTPAFDTLSELGFETFIVIEPTCQLLTIGKQSLGETFGTWLPGAGQAGSDDWRTLLQGLTYLYLNGTDIEWSAAYRDLPRRRIGLPTYPFDRHRYWVEPPVVAQTQTVAAAPPVPSFDALAASIAEVSIRTLAENGESPTEGDVNLFDAQGKLVLSLPGRRISQTIKVDSLPDSSWFYELQWKEISHPATVSQSETPGSWIIFTHRNKFGRALTALLEAAGETCTVIKPGAAYDNTGEDEIEINRDRAEDYDQLFAEALKPGCRGVLFLWGLDEKGIEAGGQGIDALKANLRLVQALARHTTKAARTGNRLTPKLWVITRGAQPVAGEHSTSGMVQAALWGFGRVTALEHPSLWGGLIDLAPTPSLEEATLALRTILNPDAEKETGLRGGKRFVPRLVRSPYDETQTSQMTCSADATYLVTGGVGGLGLSTARWLASRGARTLVLTGRSSVPGFKNIWLPPGAPLTKPLSPERTQRVLGTIAELESTGVKVLLAQVDVGNRDQMTALFAHLKTALPAVRGVIHSAGVATDELIATMKPASLEAAAASKVAGTLLLHEMTAGAELDFFVLYSSIAAVFGSSGQANYAAANAFEDAFAHFRRTHGLTALSINWGPWDEVGMAADHHHVGMFERVGIQSFSPRDGVKALDVLLTGSAPQKMVADIAWETFRAFYDAFTPHPLLFDLEVVAEPALPPPVPVIEPPVEPVQTPEVSSTPEVVEIKLPENASLEAQLKHASLELQHHLMVTYLQDRIAESLHTSRELIEPDRNLIELGLDSIIVTDLMMHFKQDLQFPIFPAEIFRQPSVNAMATYLIGEFNRRHNLPSEPPPAVIVPSVEPAVAARLKQEQEFARQTQPRERIPNVILVLSSPRSGSTLFRVMLSKHSQLFSPPELHLLPYQTMGERDRLLRSSGLDKGLIHAFNKLPGKTPAGVSQLIADLVAQNATTEELYWMLTEQISPRLLVDKTPSYAASMAVLERAEEIFDQPKYIHLMRHPYAVIESCVRNRFEVLFADLMQATAQDPLTLAEQVWTVTNSNILDFFSRIPAERRQSVRYEDMVVNPTHIMEQMCSFLNIPFEAETVRPYDGKPQSEGKGWQHEGIGDPNFFEHNAIDPGLGDVWKTIRLPRRLGGLARRVAEELGYELPGETGFRVPGSGSESGFRVQGSGFKDVESEAIDHPDLSGPQEISDLSNTGFQTLNPEPRTLALDSQTLNPEPRTLVLEPVSRDQKLPLSPLQQMFWMLDKLKPASSFDHAPMNVTYNRRFRGQFKVEVLERCFSEIIRRHEALRTTFVAIDGQPVQIIHPASEFRLAPLDQVPADFRLKPVNDNVNVLVDLSSLPATEQAHAVEAIVTSEAQRLFDISVGPLIRVVVLRLSPEDHVLLLNIHHIVSDGWSVNVLIQELSALYNAFGAGQPSPLPALPIQYADFAYWQQQWIAEHKLDDGIKYWKDQLTGAPPLLTLPTDFPRPAVQSFRGARETIEIPQELYAALKGLSQSQGATLFMTVLAAFQTLLSKYARQEDIVVGTPIANRDLFETKRLIGFFTNVLALRTDVSGDPTFAELLGRVREMTIAAFTHQNVPFQKVIEAVQPQRDLSYPPIFQVMLVLQNTVKQAISLENLTVEIIDADTGTARNDLTFELLDIGNRISGVVEYNTSLFTAGTIQRMIGQFHALLEHIIEDPNRPLSGLSLLSPQEVNLLAQWNQTEAVYPRHLKAHELFEAQVRQNPDATALVYAEKDEAGRFQEVRLTYREVNVRAEQLAHYLRDQDVTPYTRVGLCLAPSVELLVGMLAILKAGGAFVPLDPAYPQTRLEFMIRDARLPVILTHSTLVEALPTQTAQILCLDQLPVPTYTTPIEQVKQPAASPVYVIYTSGSTGMPKGVAIKHQSVVNLAGALASQFSLTSDDRVLQFASLSFDTAIEEIFPTLHAGATLVCVKDVRMSSAVELLETITATGITVLDLPTAYWHLLVREMVKGKLPVPPSLRLVILGGEQASNEVLDLWFGLVGDRVRLINTYGPTEATVSATLYEARPDQKLTSKVPIGRPIANTQVLVLDQHLKPVPIGVPGELFIGGDGVAIGYLNQRSGFETGFRVQGSGFRSSEPKISDQPENQGFKDLSNLSKASPQTLNPEPRTLIWYQTGDLVRWLADGNLEFLGRVDDQVKIRGYRVEPGEIEKVLATHPEIAEVIVLAKSDRQGNQQLIAYVVPRSGPVSVETAHHLEHQIQAFLHDRLPEFMIPSVFVVLERFPLTPNGKVDRTALPQAEAHAETTFVAPRNPVEAELAKLWAEVLGREQVGVHDTFFSLGGHSLLAAQIVFEIRERFQVDIPLRLIFERPTIADLALAILQLQAEKADAAEMESMLAELDQLSDDEVRLLLASESHNGSKDPEE